MVTLGSILAIWVWGFVSHWALATGLEVVVVCCVCFVQCFFAGRELIGIWQSPSNLSRLLRNQRLTPANTDGSLKRKRVTHSGSHLPDATMKYL
jgi:hypothetical protein